MNNANTYDILILGGGIVGLTVARELALRRYGTILVLEKEATLGQHASGRNSGVLHTGIYYGADSLKAKVCANGAKMLRDYALERNIPLRKTGKVIVAQSPQVVDQIDVLYARALRNGATVEKIDAAQLARIEPEARTFGQALYSPDTAVIDAHAVLAHLQQEIESLGVAIKKSSRVVSIDPAQKRVRAQCGMQDGFWCYGHLVNAAGLHADEIAHGMGVGQHYRILPFKGLYRKLGPDAAKHFRGSIYPAPDLAMPFLGVHITRTVQDEVIVGPTAIPALGRENYGLLDGLSPKDFPSIVGNLLVLIAKNEDGFRALVKEELRKYWGPEFLKRAAALAPSLKKEDFIPGIAKVGIRAQLLDTKKKKMVMDFVVEDGPDSTHILNAISPAFTSSFAFAQRIADRIGLGVKE